MIFGAVLTSLQLTAVANQPPVTNEIVKPITTPELEQVIQLTKTGTLSRAAIEELRKQPEPLLEALETYMHDERYDMEKRWFATMALARIGGDQTLNKLLNGLKSSAFNVRMASVKGIEILAEQSALGYQHLLPPLHATLESDKAMVVREAVVDTLANLKSRDSLSLLFAELYKSENFYRGKSLPIRSHVIRALGHIGGEETIPILIRCLNETETALVNDALLSLNPLEEIPAMTIPQLKEQWQLWSAAQVVGPPLAPAAAPTVQNPQ